MKRKRLNLWVVGAVLILEGVLLYIHNYRLDIKQPEFVGIPYDVSELPEVAVEYTGDTDITITLDEASVLAIRDIKAMRKDISRLKLWAWGERDEGDYEKA